MTGVDQIIVRWEPMFQRCLVYSRKTKALDTASAAELQSSWLVTHRSPPTDGLVAPMKIFLAITRACDLDCPFCFARGRRYGSPMSTGTIVQVIHQAADAGVFEIRLTGGEPTVHPAFFDIAALIDHLGMNCSLNTHGAFHEPLIEKLIDSPVDDIRISIDGPEEIHDSLRGNGSFQRAIRTVGALRESGKSVRVNSMVYRGNADALDTIIDLAAELGVSLRLCPMRAIGRAREPVFAQTYVLCQNEWHRIEDNLATRGLFRKHVSCFSIDDLEDFSHCPGPTAGLEEAHCSPWVTQMGIDPNGTNFSRNLLIPLFFRPPAWL